MKIVYEPKSTTDALREYCDWLIDQQDGKDFFHIYEVGRHSFEWYMVFYPVRTLLLGGKLLNEPKYIEAATKSVDLYLTEQLPNGGFTSNFRGQDSSTLTNRDVAKILRAGNVNLADNGSNLLAVAQAAACVDADKRKVYLDAVRKWFDLWVPIWVLPDGGLNNGLWGGEVHHGAYTCAIGTVAAALSAFVQVSGEYEYMEIAENAIRHQMDNWFPDEDGRPVNLDSYITTPHEPIALNDFGHSFYLLEGMCWTHRVTKDVELKKSIEHKLKVWIFGGQGLLSQWGDSWFNYMVTAHPWYEKPTDPPTSRQASIRLGWEMAKSNGIMHTFAYYLNHIDDNVALREKLEKGIDSLTHPLKARMSGVMSDPAESYGAFAVQATGFAGLSLAEAIRSDSVFE